MKKLVLSTLAVMTLMLTTQMNAQSDKGLFFSINGGYNFSSASQNLPFNNTIRIESGSSSNITTTENVYSSLGKGLNFGGAIGYMFNKNIGAELGINYLIGGEVTNTFEYKFNNGSNTSNSSTTLKTSSKMLQFRPTIILTAGMDKINPYAKFGILIGSGSINQVANSISISSSSTAKNTFDEIRKLEGDTAIGFHSAFGLLYNVNEKISIFGELNMVNLSFAPTKGTITSSIENGVDQIPSSSIRNLQTEYVDTTSSTDSNSSTSPRKQLKETYSLSSFGVNFGLKYSL